MALFQRSGFLNAYLGMPARRWAGGRGGGGRRRRGKKGGAANEPKDIVDARAHLAAQSAMKATNAAPVNIARDTVIFTCERKRIFQLMSVTAVSQFTFWAFVATYALKINIDGDPDPMALPNSGDTKSDGEADDADVDSNSAQGNDSASGGGNSAAAAEDAPAVAVKVSKSEKVEKSGSWYMPTKGPIADAISYVWPSSKVEKKKKGDDAGENKAQEGASSPHEQQLVAASSDTDGDQIDLQQDAAATKVQEVAVASKAEAEAEAEAEDEEGEEDGTPFETWALRGGMCFVATGISIAMLSFGVIVPRRYTHTMTILKDAKTVRIGTYQLIGERSFEVPITALKFQHKNVPDPLSKISTYEIDGTKGFHLMDSKAGFFPDTRLFHWVLYRTQN